MDVTYRLRRQEKYKDIFLPFVTALAAAHTFLCHDLPGNPFKVIFASNYFTDLGINFIFALLVFFTINLISRFLDTNYSWDKSKWTRLWLQFLLGVIGTMTISVIAASVYFGKDGPDIANKAFFDVIFYMLLGYVVSVNIYYNAVAVVYWNSFGKKLHPPLPVADSGEDHATRGSGSPVLNLLMKHDVTLFHTAKDTTYATESDGNKIFWPFRINTTLAVLDTTKYIRVNRYYVVRRDAIAEVRREGFKDRMLLTLKPPYNEQITVTTKYMDDFNSWWYELRD